MISPWRFQQYIVCHVEDPIDSRREWCQNREGGGQKRSREISGLINFPGGSQSPALLLPFPQSLNPSLRYINFPDHSNRVSVILIRKRRNRQGGRRGVGGEKFAKGSMFLLMSGWGITTCQYQLWGPCCWMQNTLISELCVLYLLNFFFFNYWSLGINTVKHWALVFQLLFFFPWMFSLRYVNSLHPKFHLGIHTSSDIFRIIYSVFYHPKLVPWLGPNFCAFFLPYLGICCLPGGFSASNKNI